MGPLAHGRAESLRMRAALKKGDVGAWATVALAAMSLTSCVTGALHMKDAEDATLFLGAGVVLGQLAWTLRSHVRSGALGPDWLRFGTHTLFWLTLLMGLVIVVNGRVPFLGETLEKTPGQNVATDLGNALLGGLIVAAVLIVIELAQRRRDERAVSMRQQESDRSTMLLFLGLERDLSHVDLSDRDLSWFSLRNRNMTGARLRRCCLFRTNLEGCILSESEFNDADLTNAFLEKASFAGAHLHRAVLHHAHLKNADLTGAEIFGASFRNADLRNATLCGADLRATDLRDTDLRGADLQGARYNSDTLLPNGFELQTSGMLLDDSPLRFDLPVPTGPTLCGADHEADRTAWERQQGRATEDFRLALVRRRQSDRTPLP